ncbi:MAG: LacI family DNA-binding transcriptional regulator [Granulosicoccus sp.]
MKEEDYPEKITADDVAELAGVSRWTVNRAFKKDASISTKSLAKVLAAATQLGYAPDLLAASLASDRSNLVSMVVDDFSNPHKLVMMERLSRILRKHGFGTLLVNTLDEDDAGAALLTASQLRVDAAVLIGSRFDDQVLATALGAQRVRKLIVFARLSADPNTISICCDDEAAMAEITQHVSSSGYQRPTFLAGPQTKSAHVLRAETFLVQWQRANGRDAQFTSVGSYDPQMAYAHVKDLFTRLPKEQWPDVLVCENDALAIGTIDALRHELGLRVPDDIAVTGFDDTPQAASPNYRLTTYRQPITAMAEALVAVLNGETYHHDLNAFCGRLVVRESA